MQVKPSEIAFKCKYFIHRASKAVDGLNSIDSFQPISDRRIYVLPSRPVIRRPPNPTPEFLIQSISLGDELLKVNEFSLITHPNMPNAKEAILEQIHMLLKTKTGREIFELLSAGEHPVTVEIGNCFKLLPLMRVDMSNGKGTSCSVSTDLSFLKPGHTVETIRGKDGQVIPTPYVIALGHELIHAINCQRGKVRTFHTPTDNNYSNLEEELVITTGEGPTENKLRAEFNLPLRYGHGNHSKSI